ncbi:MAG: DUF6288 domain-containing protein [Planctomycetaceae bacterium]
MMPTSAPPSRVHRAAALAAALVGVAARGVAEERSAGPPDLTVSRDVDRAATYNLGATGMRGWIHTKAATDLDGVQGRTTTASRQILVTHVGAGTPAAGVMAIDDVILGAEGRPFTGDARQAIARAIQRAETVAGDGALALTRWRAGTVDEVQLSLPVLGDYAGTAPYDCPKSARILARAVAVLAREPLAEDIWAAVNGLALLASGDEQHLPRVRDLARRLATTAPELDPRRMGTWEMGYRNLFLCEYHLRTGDPHVLPAIELLTLALARGQSRYGTFGHGFAEPAADGGPHGSIPPYGPVNAAGLVANLAIVTGRRCGVTDPEVVAAIDRACRFFGYYVDKGSIPYGEHAPWPYHENNGKNSLAALFFALEGGQPRAARYFAMMATAAYANREYGHTGQGFSYLWSGLGAGCGGPSAAAAFFREASWHFDLARRCDGSFAYDGSEQYGGGQTDDGTYGGPSSYYGLSPTACFVLTYALPRRTLLITGREAAPGHALDTAAVTEAIAAGRFDIDRERLPLDELVTALGGWSPVARGWAAEELARRPEAARLVPTLIGMAEGDDTRAAQGACETLGRLRAAAAVPVCVRLLVHEDRWLRTKAAEALGRLGATAAPALPDMLRAAAAGAEPCTPVAWDDPVQIAHGQLAETLFSGLLHPSLDGVDRGLLHPAIRAVSRNADGMARATLRHLLEHQLTAADVAALAPDILTAVETRCPADTMFGNEIRLAGLRALARHHFREAIDAALTLARTQGGHGSESRTGEIMHELASFGAAAQPAVPALRELIESFEAQAEAEEFPEGPLNEQRIEAVRDAIRMIEAAEDAPPLRSISRR